MDIIFDTMNRKTLASPSTDATDQELYKVNVRTIGLTVRIGFSSWLPSVATNISLLLTLRLTFVPKQLLDRSRSTIRCGWSLSTTTTSLQDMFTHQHITQFRLGLHAELSTVHVPTLRPEHCFSSFFPDLSNDFQLASAPGRFLTNDRSCPSETGLMQKGIAVATLKVTDNGSESQCLKDIRKDDLHFREIFLKTPCTFSDNMNRSARSHLICL
jgi:hypothetical protein